LLSNFDLGKIVVGDRKSIGDHFDVVPEGRSCPRRHSADKRGEEHHGKTA
jgi:hypothetical protein